MRQRKRGGGHDSLPPGSATVLDPVHIRPFIFYTYLYVTFSYFSPRNQQTHTKIVFDQIPEVPIRTFPGFNHGLLALELKREPELGRELATHN